MKNAGMSGWAVVIGMGGWALMLGTGCTQSFRSASLEQQIDAFKQTTGHLADLAARTDAAYRAEFEYDGSEAEAYIKQSAGLRVPIRIRLGVFGNAKGDHPMGSGGRNGDNGGKWGNGDKGASGNDSSHGGAGSSGAVGGNAGAEDSDTK